MAQAEEATMKTSFDKVRKLRKNIEGDLYSVTTKKKMAKGNSLVWDLKKELGWSNNYNLINMTKLLLDVLKAIQMPSGCQANSMLDIIATSQKIKA